MDNSEFCHQSQIQRTVYAEVLRLTEIQALSAVQAGLVRNQTPRRRPLHGWDEGADGLMKRCSETGASLLHLLLPLSIPLNTTPYPTTPCTSPPAARQASNQSSAWGGGCGQGQAHWGWRHLFNKERKRCKNRKYQNGEYITEKDKVADGEEEKLGVEDGEATSE